MEASTQKLVQMMAKQMNYRPKASARALAGGRTHTVGLLFVDTGAGLGHILSWYASTFKMITTMLAERDYFMSLATWSRSHEESEQSDSTLPRMFRESAIEAALMVRTPSGPLLERTLRQQHLPLVMIDAAPAPGRITVAVNECRAAELAVEHLVQLGHRRIVYIPLLLACEPGPAVIRNAVGPYVAPRLSEYPRGYARAMVAASLLPSSGWDEPFPDDGYEPFLKRLFATSDPPTALIVADDIAAVSAISWLPPHGIQVPRDVSVVSLCSLGELSHDMLANMYPTHGVTCQKNMQEQVAAIAVEKLMQLIKNPSEPVESVLLDPELVVRGSTGPCPG